MTILKDAISKHLVENGLNIYDQYKVKSGDYLFYSDDMILLINEQKNVIKVSFQATSKPEDVTRNLLVLQRIPKINIKVLESFIFGEDNKILYGDAAFNLIKKSIEIKAINEYTKEMSYATILTTAECYEC